VRRVARPKNLRTYSKILLQFTKKFLYYEHIRILYSYHNHMKHLTQVEFNPAIADGIVVVDFFAERCGPCKMIAPYLDQMQEKLAGHVNFYKVDVDEENAIAAQQGITAMPTLKIFKDGKEVKTIVGADLQGLWDGIQEQLSVKN
jgi:thioredoxin 1